MMCTRQELADQAASFHAFIRRTTTMAGTSLPTWTSSLGSCQKPGRQYEQAVKAFEPYDRIKEENPEARTAGRALIAEGQAAGPKRKTFLFVNNRLEGKAIATIASMMQPG